MIINDNSFKFALLEGAELSDHFELPILKKTTFIPIKAISFDKAKNSSKNQWVHFYTNDKRFECLWNNPLHYLDMLKKFEGVITPDFSIYFDLPITMQIWNTFRSRTLAYWLQSNGVNIVPNIRWGDERSYPFAFEAIEQGGMVSIGSYGNIKTNVNCYYFEKGLEKMIETIKPETIICFGSTPDKVFKKYKDAGVCFINIPSEMSLIHKKEKI